MNWHDTAKEFTDRVLSLIASERNAVYGEPHVNHERTAEVWSWYLRHRYGVSIELDGLAVCALNRLQKESRMCETPDHRDSLDDIAGFAGNAHDCIDCAPIRYTVPPPVTMPLRYRVIHGDTVTSSGVVEPTISAAERIAPYSCGVDDTRGR